MGRPSGGRNACHVVDRYENLILKMYAAAESKRKIARAIKVSPPTITRFIDSQKQTDNGRTQIQHQHIGYRTHRSWPVWHAAILHIVFASHLLQ